MKLPLSFFIGFLFSFLNVLNSANGSADSLLAILKAEKLTPEERIGRARNSVFYKELLGSDENFNKYCALTDDWCKNAKDLTPLFLSCFIKGDILASKNEIGELFTMIDQFKQKADVSKRHTDLIFSLTLYDRAYSNLALYKEGINVSSQLYHLRKNTGSLLLQGECLNSYTWALYTKGNYLKDKNILDSCAYYHELFLQKIKPKLLNEGGVSMENYRMYLFFLNNIKNYKRAVEIAHELAAFSCKYQSKEKVSNDFNLSVAYQGCAYAKFHLGESDSAFYYYNLALKHNKDIVDIRDGAIYFLAQLGRYKEAAKELMPYIYGNEIESSSEYYKWLCNFAAPIFEKAGKFKEAANCYGIYQAFSDSLKKVQQEKQNEYERVKTNLIIESERKTAALASEKITLENKNKSMIINTGIIFMGIFSMFFLIVYRRYKLTQKQKNIIESQKQVLVKKNAIIEDKHKEITDSINYAERIQKSFMATKRHLDSNLKDYFILFQPKAIVSGDFYWSCTLNNGCFAIATADSTGHGVPGAIMSLLNITSLEKAVETFSMPSDILNSTREIIIERLKRDGSSEGGKDGMDCSLCVYDFKHMKLYTSSANNPVWIIRASEIIEIKPDKMPVGKHDRQDTPFTQYAIELKKGDVIYTLTDGFPDQFGGEKGKKFMSKNLRELLCKNAHLSMIEQKQFLQTTFYEWMGSFEQVDDVTLIGIRV